jgi:hypothetical protein
MHVLSTPSFPWDLPVVYYTCTALLVGYMNIYMYIYTRFACSLRTVYTGVDNIQKLYTYCIVPVRYASVPILAVQPIYIVTYLSKRLVYIHTVLYI